MIQREWTPDDYIMMVRRRWPLILSLALLGGLGVYMVSRFLPNRYTSQSVVLVQQATVPTDYVRSVVTAGVGERLTTMRQQILSRTRLEPIIKQLGLFSADVGKMSTDALVGRLQSAITVTPLRAVGDEENARLPGFSISVTLDTPQSAQLVCSTVTSMFIEENLKTREQHSEDTTQFISQRLVEEKAKLDEQDAKLAAFKSRYLGYLPEEVQTNLNLLSSLNSELDATTQAISRAQQDKSMAESMLSQQIAAWRASQSGHNPDTYQEQLAALQIQLASLQTKYTDDHPDVIKTKTEIEAVKRKIAESNNAASEQASSAESSQFRPLRAQILGYDQTITAKTAQQARIQEQIKQYQERVQLSPSIEQQYKALTRDYQTALDTYNDLSKKQNQSTIATDLERDQEAEQFRIMDAANLPTSPSFPNRPMFALGGLGGGLAFGLGLAFLLEVRDTSLRTETDVENALELPVLAMVPAIDVLQQADVGAS